MLVGSLRTGHGRQVTPPRAKYAGRGSEAGCRSACWPSHGGRSDGFAVRAATAHNAMCCTCAARPESPFGARWPEPSDAIALLRCLAWFVRVAGAPSTRSGLLEPPPRIGTPQAALRRVGVPRLNSTRSLHWRLAFRRRAIGPRPALMMPPPCAVFPGPSCAPTLRSCRNWRLTRKNPIAIRLLVGKTRTLFRYTAVSLRIADPVRSSAGRWVEPRPMSDTRTRETAAGY
jgi:hypothetical protein